MMPSDKMLSQWSQLINNFDVNSVGQSAKNRAFIESVTAFLQNKGNLNQISLERVYQFALEHPLFDFNQTLLNKDKEKRGREVKESKEEKEKEEKNAMEKAIHSKDLALIQFLLEHHGLIQWSSNRKPSDIFTHLYTQLCPKFDPDIHAQDEDPSFTVQSMGHIIMELLLCYEQKPSVPEVSDLFKTKKQGHFEDYFKKYKTEQEGVQKEAQEQMQIDYVNAVSNQAYKGIVPVMIILFAIPFLSRYLNLPQMATYLPYIVVAIASLFAKVPSQQEHGQQYRQETFALMDPLTKTLKELNVLDDSIQRVKNLDFKISYHDFMQALKTAESEIRKIKQKIYKQHYDASGLKQVLPENCLQLVFMYGKQKEINRETFRQRLEGKSSIKFKYGKS